MSLSERRILLLGGGAALALAGCGFRPMHEKGGAAARLYGRVLLPEATDPASFAFRERLRRRLGAAGDALWRLESRVEISEAGTAETRASDITRYRVSGRARYTLVALADGVAAAEGVIEANAGYDAVAGVYATRSARLAAEERVAIELAERLATRLLADAEAIARRES